MHLLQRAIKETDKEKMMASTESIQSQELAKQLWAIANDLRGNMDASKFKNYSGSFKAYEGVEP